MPSPFAAGLPPVSRRRLLAGAVAGLAMPVSLRAAAQQRADNEALYAAAKKEGKFVWWGGTYDQPTLQSLRRAWNAAYPGIDMDYIWATGEVVYTRIQQNLQAGVNEVDVFCTSNAGHWPLLKKQGSLLPLPVVEAEALNPAFRNVDPDNTFRANGVETVVINYRTDQVSAPPKAWTGLVDPQWRGKVTLGSPVYSGDMVNWTIAILDQHGPDLLRTLADADPKIGRSILGTGTDLISGERSIGVGLLENTSLLKHQGDPVDVVVPEEGAVLAFGYTGIPRNAPHPNAAKLFMNFMQSKAYSQALTETFRFPLRDDVPSTNGFELATMKTYKSSVERLTTGTNGAIRAWKDAFGA